MTEKRETNLIIYVLPESIKSDLAEKRAEDEKKIKEILISFDKYEVKPVFSRRLNSKEPSKPGPILVELAEVSLRNPVLLAAKKLKTSKDHMDVYISPDLTEAERRLDFELRQERNKLNSQLGKEVPFRYGIRGNQLNK
jgi:hypothetical protein